MDIGFVGTEQELRRFVDCFAPATRFTLQAVLLDPPSAAAAALAHHCSDLDELLAWPNLHAVLLGGPVALRCERLRRIVQMGRPCLVLHPAGHSAIGHHEAALIAADHTAVILPMLRAHPHPAWRAFQADVAAGRVGRVREVLLERNTASSTESELVIGDYAEAADLVAELTGPIAEITASGDLPARRLLVLHRAASGTTAEVRLAPDAQTQWRIEVLGDAMARGICTCATDWAGAATIEWRAPPDQTAPAAAPGASAEPAGARQHSQSIPLDASVEQMMIGELERAVRGEPYRPAWSRAIDAAELAEAVRLSLERRRSVEVYQQERGELASFKGRMTSFGCGLIWFTLAMLILIAAGKGLEMPGTDWLAWGLVAVWVVFLGLQGLRWVLPSESGSAAHAPETRRYD